MAEPLNATFFAFRKREPGGALLGSSIAFAIAIIVMFAVFAAIAWFALGGSSFFEWYGSMMEAASKGEEPSTPPNMGAIFMIFPLEMIFAFVLCVLIAAYESACLRWMIHGERSGALNLHFGADMWRTYGTYWVWFLYFMLSWIAFWIALVVIGLTVGGSQAGSNPWAAGGVVSGFCLLWALAWTYVATRLAPASATNIGIGNFAPLKAWRVSSGRFWALFGAFFLIWLLYVIVMLVLVGVTTGSFYASIFSQVDWSQAQTNPTAVEQQYQQASMRAMRDLLSNPLTIATYIGGQIVMYAVGVVFYLLFYGVNARAVQAALEEGKIERAAAT